MNTNPGRLLLVGAGGFVGPWIAQAAVAAGWKVTGFSRTPPAYFRERAPNWEFIAGDVTDPVAVAAAVASTDAVVFNAAYLPADFMAAGEARRCLEINALGPLAVLERLEASPRPFVYISTAQHYLPGSDAATENSPSFPCRHATYYLSSKLLGETFVEHYRVARGVPTAILRLGSLYGPGQARGMVGQFIQRAKKGEPLTVMDGGRHRADLTFVADVAQATVAALRTNAPGIFNVGSGQPTTTLDAARLILQAAQRSPELLKIEPPSPGRPPAGFAALDITRARRDLDFQPTLPADGLARTVREWPAS